MAKTADERGIDPPTMTGTEMKSIREKAGLSLYELAAILRYRDTRGLRRMEDEDRLISGPMQLVLEALRDGRIKPEEELQ
jgi:DNA-binding transcriptional regulator YiaG